MRVATHVPKGVMIRLHGRLVRKIKIENFQHRELSINPANCDWFLMVETDGTTWLWDGEMDP